MPKYVLTLRDHNGEEILGSLEAKTPHLAVGLAERLWNLPVLSVMVTYRVIGKCGRCGCVMFEGDQNRGRKGVLWCQDC